MSQERVPHIERSTGFPDRVRALNRVFERGAGDIYRTEGCPLRFVLVEQPGKPCSRRLEPVGVDEDAIPPRADGETPLEYCLARAMWEPSWSNGGGGLVQAYGNAMRRRSAVWYAEHHLRRHGRPPEGLHHVRARYGPPGTADIEPPLGTERGVFEHDVVYPPQPKGTP
jgi:hypothetical protein